MVSQIPLVVVALFALVLVVDAGCGDNKKTFLKGPLFTDRSGDKPTAWAYPATQTTTHGMLVFQRVRTFVHNTLFIESPLGCILFHLAYCDKTAASFCSRIELVGPNCGTAKERKEAGFNDPTGHAVSVSYKKLVDITVACDNAFKTAGAYSCLTNNCKTWRHCFRTALGLGGTPWGLCKLKGYKKYFKRGIDASLFPDESDEADPACKGRRRYKK
eukprot:TRINITY_DN1877_c0_g1_i1.p2 TRINITY_DN1877_c0_g1~~TRINITY_DN1877_c0_g1_i1.p2  ORF type:complete len:216 (-),score=65.26 TRINITY_DN1877_c0_g1_i1:59-706(-)